MKRRSSSHLNLHVIWSQMRRNKWEQLGKAMYSRMSVKAMVTSRWKRNRNRFQKLHESLLPSKLQRLYRGPKQNRLKDLPTIKWKYQLSQLELILRHLKMEIKKNKAQVFWLKGPPLYPLRTKWIRWNLGAIFLSQEFLKWRERTIKV